MSTADVFLEKAKKNHEAARWAVDNGNYCAAANRHYYALIQAIRAKLESQSARVDAVCNRYTLDRLRGRRNADVDWSEHAAIVTWEAMKQAGLSVKYHKIIHLARRYRIDSDYKPFMVDPGGVKHVDAESGAILKILGVRI